MKRYTFFERIDMINNLSLQLEKKKTVRSPIKGMVFPCQAVLSPKLFPFLYRISIYLELRGVDKKERYGKLHTVAMRWLG